MTATADHIDAFLGTIEAHHTSLTEAVRATALDPASATTKLSRAVGLLFNGLTAQVDAFEGQVETLFPPFVKLAPAQLADAKRLVLQLKGRLKVLEGMKPSDDPVLMKCLGGIATKMAVLTDRYQKAAGGPVREDGLGGIHAPGESGNTLTALMLMTTGEWVAIMRFCAGSYLLRQRARGHLMSKGAPRRERPTSSDVGPTR
ncbi:hypothetical protein BC629DRAFT_1477245 [Irpex lacteus]|nr:hypothetical protein BC629DRAFT_1477245 [Irpex lacteus]